MRRTPAQQRIGGKNGEADPDQTEGDEMTACERFMIKKYAEEKCAGRREILQETKRREAQMPGGIPKPNLRQRSDNAGGPLTRSTMKCAAARKLIGRSSLGK